MTQITQSGGREERHTTGVGPLWFLKAEVNAAVDEGVL